MPVGDSDSVPGQVVGSRGRIEINPRDTMSKESSIVGVSLFLATEVRSISVLKCACSSTPLLTVKIICRNERIISSL